MTKRLDTPGERQWATTDTSRSGKPHLWREAYTEGLWLSECGRMAKTGNLQRNESIGPRCQKCEGSRHV